LAEDAPRHKSSLGVSNINADFCHGIFVRILAGLCFGVLLVPILSAQPGRPSLPLPPTPVVPTGTHGPRTVRVVPPFPVEDNEMYVSGIKQMREGPWYRLRGQSIVETDTFLLKGDDIDYNEDTGDLYARGSVYLQHFAGGEQLWCDHMEYNIEDDTGKFYDVRGQAPLRIEARPRVLTSSNPFYFQGKWAERLKEKYILHDGYITNCKMPKPWWIMRAPTFDIIPEDRAISHRAIFVLRRIPIFYAPYYYKSMKKLPRQSGFLTPNIGNSSTRGKMLGIGYYWAINRSYDAAYRVQYFTQRGFAHTVDFRGKIREGTDFSAILYGVQDRGLAGNPASAAPGYMLTVDGRTDLGDGFYGRGQLNYLSSFAFRQAFTETFTEAISSEVHSIGFVTKQWDTFGLDFVGQRLENFQSTAPNDNIVIRKLPEVEFSSRDRRIADNIPLYVSWEMSGGLMRRGEPDFQTRNFLERMDIYPRVSTFLHWKDFALVPSFALRETHYGESRDQFHILGQNLNRNGREFDLDLVLPSFARVYDAPKWLGDKVKHVIEPGASYKYVTGVDDFNSLIRFDQTELFSNTNQIEVWITNRLYTKRKETVTEVFSWDLRQQRYFDPTFGGAISQTPVFNSTTGTYSTVGWCGQPACRNEILSAIELTPYAFLDGPRSYSPIVSTIRTSPINGIGIEWRADYDPLHHGIVASSATIDAGFHGYFLSIGHNSMSGVPTITPNANQLRGQFRFGNENRRGWNAGFMTIYDYRVHQLQFATVQLTYNTDCCGFSVQYRRLSFGTRNENQFRLAFSVANVGSFGTLKKQERMF
jgi:LPS-assembly protein